MSHGTEDAPAARWGALSALLVPGRLQTDFVCAALLCRMIPRRRYHLFSDVYELPTGSLCRLRS